MDYLNNNIASDLLRKIEAEVALINQNYLSSSAGCPKDDIFELLEKVGTLIFYPIEENLLWGIYVNKNEKHYFIINSGISMEKQVFAAAHELAHSLEIAKVKFEVVTADLMTEYVNHKDFGEKLKKADIIANRFAAELLVGAKQLREKYSELLNISSNAAKAVILSDLFLVPYRTIVKRLRETELISENELVKLLDISDDIIIEHLSERYECRRRNLEITNEIRLGGYVNKALTLYEEDLCSFNELESRLSLLKKTPEDYNIFDDGFDVYDYLRRESTSKGLEDDNDADL
jgi:Zn-dependent peptidase ImmA (M78 family)